MRAIKSVIEVQGNTYLSYLIIDKIEAATHEIVLFKDY